MMMIDLPQHNKQKNGLVPEALFGDRWIGDIAHELTQDFVADYFRLWYLIDESLSEEDNDIT